MDTYESVKILSTTVESSNVLKKTPTGIKGFDEITVGGLPRGRTSLVCGSAGSGKTLFAMEFLVRGATEHGEPGVFLAFEETAVELAQSVASLGFDLDALVARKLLAIDFVHVERSEILETGDYDLNGLFVRLACAIDSVGAKRVVIDSLETLFSALGDEGILRSEFRRLFRWLKDRGVTAVITGERGDGTLTRHGIEEYVSDCVILLEQRVHERVATRYLRVVKYRGTMHGTNEYPFLIDAGGISVVPVTSLGLAHHASEARMSTGVPRLDAMLDGKGIYRGTSVLVSGTPGTGKSSLAAHVVHSACRRGERCLYFAFEESQGQFVRNMRSIGVDLQPWIDQGRLLFQASRPTLFGLEMHLASMHRLVETFEPDVVVIDPVTNFSMVATEFEVRAMLMRLVDFLKSREITTIFTSLTGGSGTLEGTDIGISSLMDTWLLVQFLEGSGERNRGLYVLKSRGMAHSNQVREFHMGSHGIDLLDVYVGSSGVLTGSARQAQEAKERAESITRQQEIERKQRDLTRKRAQVEAQILALRAEFEAEEQEVLAVVEQDKRREVSLSRDREQMARLRQADPSKQQNGGAR
ncbi:circadian clock protein KaiC [Polyangium mundeleinium]|uniref:non-specific serine/threonine protein kinase n=1 Tax=Polyangium mundeleinium TaxID=2995306 RepID=A0ABT5EEI5_9BACT|nr:circadian clock protein KaiC [Polyangium mundeleinium]MDC0740221.1 circadian clock protein KaiC [Polyangium mundeleinium]